MTDPRPAPVLWNGASYQTILSTDETGGSMSVLCISAPPHSGPPTHVHGSEDETFIILDGMVDVVVGDRQITCGPMQTAFVPRGVAHSFRTGAKGATGLTILTPGGFEGFFAEMARSGLNLPQDLVGVRAIAARYGARFIGPGLAQMTEGGVASPGLGQHHA